MDTHAREREECLYEELGHTSEIGLRLRAPSTAALFACAAEATFGLLNVEIAAGALQSERQITLEALDAESLLVDWLSELLYLYATTGEIFPHCTITEWQPTRLSARVKGGRPEQPPAMDIKAVTYHQIQVAEDEEGWLGQVYFDI